jgi:hypothetical protein
MCAPRMLKVVALAGHIAQAAETVLVLAFDPHQRAKPS